MQTSYKYPVISIITVTYNAADLIETTIKSVLSQTYSAIEYIIIDGCSKDGTLDVIQKYKDKISYYVSEPDGGIYDAMNKGIKASHGNWINFMNAGDAFYNNNVVENVFQGRVFDNKVKVLYGDVAIRYAGQSEIVKHLDQISKEKVAYSLNHQSTFVDGDWMRATMYDTTFRIAADANFFHLTYMRGYSFEYVPVIISSYESSEGVSAVNQMMLFREFNRIKCVRKYGIQWWRGFIKASLITMVRALPGHLGDRLLSMYVRIRVS